MGNLIQFGNFLAFSGDEHAAEAGEKASSGGHALSMFGLMGYLGFVLLIIFGLMIVAKPDLKNKVFKTRPAQWFEQLYLFIENMCVGIIGAHGRKYIPMIMTFWLVIFVSNVVSIFFPTAPTADLGFNLGMALIAIGYVQYEGMRTNGAAHWLHFAGPKLPLAMIPISLMIFVIELISEAMKNVSLTFRLYGNIHGGHEAVVALNKLGEAFYIPVGAFLMPIKILTCIVQALVFTLLTCVYISLVTHHEHEEGHGHDDHAAHGEAALAH